MLIVVLVSAANLFTSFRRLTGVFWIGGRVVVGVPPLDLLVTSATSLDSEYN